MATKNNKPTKPTLRTDGTPVQVWLNPDELKLLDALVVARHLEHRATLLRVLMREEWARQQDFKGVAG